jgi:hypothetical protein
VEDMVKERDKTLYVDEYVTVGADEDDLREVLGERRSSPVDFASEDPVDDGPV